MATLPPYRPAKSVRPTEMARRVDMATPPNAPPSFAAYAQHVRFVVDAALPAFLQERRDAFGVAVGGGALVADAFAALAVRGGKRLRAVLVALSYEASGGVGGASRIAPALVAIELLQSYLLAHDDWMDQDDVRRGGPSCHASLRAHTATEHDAAIGAILAGDLGVAVAQRALLAVDLPAEARLAAAVIFAEMQEKVVQGQALDVFSQGDASLGSRIRDLKTSSYTVEGPLLLGAALARGMDMPYFAQIQEFARPVGDAFQLRDDLLSLFGDPAKTGKPRGNDLREGKRTDVIREVSGDPEATRLLDAVFGVATPDETQVEALLARIVASGARDRVEARLEACVAAATRALDELPISAPSRDLFAGAVGALVFREA